MKWSKSALSALLAVGTLSSFGQEKLSFEVATIKPSAPGPASASTQPWSIAGGRIEFQNITLRNLVYYAYGSGLSTALRVTGGPDWANRNRYDVVAKAAQDVTDRQLRLMLRSLLEERFSLRIHREEQEVDVFALTLAREDGKLGPNVAPWDGTCQGREANPGDDPTIPRCFSGYRPTGIFLEGATMFAVAEALSLPPPALGRLVTDHTGLASRYTLRLEFQFPQRGQPAPPGPSIFTAIQEQWGLRLVPGKGTLSVVVVDQAALPTEN